MPWPLSQDYNEAIQSPAICFNDPELKQGEAITNAIGLPMPRSGNFADVYEFQCPGGKKWAIKCFTREVAGLRERYAAISAYLKQVNLPFMVDFEYLDPGIKVRGQWFPLLKMHWVEGLTLNEFVNKNADQPAMLDLLSQIWVRLARRLSDAQMAHADLQHGNVLLVPGKTANSLSIKLIDYDGMFVPALARTKSGEVGHPNYQHPQRLREGIYNAEVDRFPHLVIYTALRSLIVGSRYLWNRYDNSDNLLFKQADLNAPEKSALFLELLRLKNPQVHKLVQVLSQSTQKSLKQTPLLDDLVTNRQAIVPAAQMPAHVEATPEADFASIVSESGSPTSGYRRRKKSFVGRAVGVLGVLSVVGCLAAGGVWFAFQPSSKSTRNEVALATTRNLAATKPATAMTVKNPGPDTKPKPHPAPPLVPQPEVQPKPVPNLGEPSKIGELLCLKGHTAEVASVAFSPDGRRCVSGSPDKTVRLWDLATGKEIRTLLNSQSGILSVAYSPDGRRVLAAGYDRVAYLCDVESGKEIYRLPGHGHNIHSVGFLPDGHTGISASIDGMLRLWNLDNGTEIPRFPKNGLSSDGHGSQIWSMSVASDGRTILCGLRDQTIRVMDVETGRVLRTLEGHIYNVIAVTFSSDNRRAISGNAYLFADGKGKDNTLRVWDVESGKELHRYEKLFGEGGIYSLAYSPNGHSALVGGQANHGLLIDLDTGKELMRLDGHTGGIKSVGIYADGRYALTGSTDGTIRLWGLPKSDLKPEPRVNLEPKPEPMPKVELNPPTPKVLQDKTETWSGSNTNYATFRNLVFDVGIGNRPDGRGAGLAGVEIENGRHIRLIIERSPAPLKQMNDDNTFTGFMVDYHTANGYVKRVGLSMGKLFTKKRNANGPSWGKASPPDEYVDVATKTQYDLDLAAWAPKGWDSKVWLSIVLQNTVKDARIKGRLELPK